MSTSMRILMAFAILISILPADMVMAAEPSAVIPGIGEFTPYFSQLAAFEEFGKVIPMSNISPGEALGLDKLFADAFTDISNYSGSIPGSYDITDITYVDTVTAEFSYDAENAVTLVFTAERSMPVPILYVNNPEEDPDPTETGTCFDSINNDDDNLIDGDDPDCTFIMIDGGKVQNVDFKLVAKITFDIEGGTIYLKGEPEITLTYDSGTGIVQAFSARYGFADITVQGTAQYHATINTVIRDENGDGKIFTSDWDNTILVDLVAMDYVDNEGDDVAINLTFTAPLLDEPESGNLILEVDDLSDESVLQPVLLPSPALNSFKTVGADDMLTGLASYAYALNTVWVVNEGDLPFIDEKLHNLFMPGESLLNLVKRQGDALVICGTEPTSPPSGNPDAGGSIYCQAFTSQEPSDVVGWSEAGSPSTSFTFQDVNGDSAALTDTIGMQPSAWAVVEPDNWKNIEVEFAFLQDEPGKTHIAEPRIRSANELQAKIEQALGITVPLSFDAESLTLIYGINSVIDPEPGSVHLAFGNTLRSDTGVTNVQDDWTADTEAVMDRTQLDIGPVTINAGFGTILVPDFANILPNSAALETGVLCSNNLDDDDDGLVDSYDPDCPQKEDRFFMDLSDGNRILSIDGLDVTVPAGYSMPGSIGALGVGVKVNAFSITSSLPFAVDLTSETIQVIGLENGVQNAVGVKDLIAIPTDNGIFVAHSQSMSMSGNLNVISQGLITSEDPKEEEKGIISINWEDVTDPDDLFITFDNLALKAFDLYPADSQMPEDPQALIMLILDSLYKQTSAMYNQEETGKPLPVIGMSMRELVPQFKKVMDAAGTIKTGKSLAEISCSANPDESLIECWAVSSLLLDEIETVAWSIHNLPIVSTENMDEPATIWPSAGAGQTKVQFTIGELNDTQSLAGISVSLELNGTTIQYPYLPPQTLLELKQSLASKLGMEVNFSVSGVPGNYFLNVEVSSNNNAYETKPFPLRLSLSGPDDIQATLIAKVGETLNFKEKVDFTLAYEFPLNPETTMDEVAFRDRSAVEIDVDVNESDFDEIEASLGGYSLMLGSLSTASTKRPGLTISVAPSPTTYSMAGEIINLIYTVTNTGEFTLTAPFAVVDDKAMVDDKPGVDCSDAPEILEPGDDFTCNASYTTTSEDANQLAITSKAYAEGMFGNISLQSLPEDIPITNLAELPRLELSVSTAPELLGAVDSTINYTYTIKNIGNVAVNGPFSINVENDLLTVDCSTAAPSLAVGETIPCTATHIVTQTDIDSGFSTVAVASGTFTFNGADEAIPVDSNLVNHEILAVANQNLELEISITPEHLFGMPGDELQVDFLITNIGNVSLSGPYEILENEFGETTCSAPPSGMLAPGESITCDPVTYAPNDDEWIAGLVESSASASAKYGNNVVESLEATASAELTDVSKQSEFSVKFSARLVYGNLSWSLKIEPIKDEDQTDPINEAAADETPDDIVINLAARTAGDDSESLGLLTYHGKATADPIVTMPQEMVDGLGIQPLDVTMLPLSLPWVSDMLVRNLDGDLWDVRMPMVGGNLAAGAEDDIRAAITGWETALGDLDVSGAANPKDIYKAISNAVNTTAFSDAATVSIDIYCVENGVESVCNEDGSGALSAITDVQIVVAGYVKPVSEKNIPFETGLPGVPLEITSEDPLTANTGWTLNLTFGIDRFKGPYIAQVGTDLTVNSTVTIADFNCDQIPLTLPFTFQSTNTRCMEGYIGLFKGKLYDGNGLDEDNAPSKVDLTTTVTVRRDLGYADLLNGLGAQAPASSISENGDARINLLFVTEKSGGIPLPIVVGTIHLTYEDEDGYLMYYDNLYMDSDTFFTGFLDTALKNVRKFTQPLQPIVDTITAPIPVVSDLSTMTGNDAISILSLLQAVADLAEEDDSDQDSNDGEDDKKNRAKDALELIEKLAAIISYINNIPASQGWIGLGPSEDEGDNPAGAFTVNIEKAERPKCGESDNASSNCKSDGEKESPRNKEDGEDDPENKAKRNKSSTVESKTESEVKWEDAGISLPVLEDTLQVYDMLLGMDATLIRVDLGTLSASAGMEYSFGPFMVGPVPVSITIGGTVTLSGRFAMGYDTRGLRQWIRGESLTGDALIDGIFIDDLDVEGNDVPEIVLEVDIYAGAAVSIKIFEAGVRGGVIFGVDLNWNDPNHDGKLRIDEIAMWMYKPICLFDRHGYIGFYLKFYLKIDLFLFTARIEWTALEKTYDLFNVSCVPPQPKLGQVDGERFRLNMGPNSGARNLPTGPDEKFIVRQLTPKEEGCASNSGESCNEGEWAGTWISITFMGIYQEFLVPLGNFIYADAGDGNDTISLLPGTDKRQATRGAEVPFTLNSELYGGSGDDQIDTGLGIDTVYGGLGNDIINTRGGDDRIVGGPPSIPMLLSSDDDDPVTDMDSLDGGIGNDVVRGGADRDMLNGGPGSDVMDGGLGDDSLSGGPGLPPGQTPDITLEDMADILIGGEGDDVLEGTFGRDYLFGDNLVGSSITNLVDLRDQPANWDTFISVADACANESGTGRDNLIGGADDDFLFGGGDDDQLQGEKGDDILCGSSGHDTLVGGTGDDSLNGGPDDDDLMGGSGMDTLEGGLGNDILLGDTLNIDGHDLTENGDLEDHPFNTDNPKPPSYVVPMNETFENSHLYNDVLSGGPGNDFLFGEVGDDTLYGDGELPLGEDWSLVGVGAADYMEGNAGNDTMDGNDGADYMLGGQGDDNMYGGKVANDDLGDFMWGNSGDDNMWGNAGNDQMNGNTGDDYIEGNADQDTIHGGPDADHIIGGSGQDEQSDVGDFLYGDEGDDWITGDNAINTSFDVKLLDVETRWNVIDAAFYGPDEIYGNEGNDHIWGQGGEDKLNGGPGDDYIEGNHASDTIQGGDGDDDILGGSSPLYADSGSIMFTDASTQRYDGVPLGESQNVTILLGDTIEGGDGSDCILGDNGIITRPGVQLSYVLETATYGDVEPIHDATSGIGNRAVREVQMLNPTPGVTAGSDWIEGGAGDDDIYGQFDDTYLDTADEEFSVIGDLIWGGDGQDLILGDQGTAVSFVVPGASQLIRSNPPFLKDVILLSGTLHWVVTLAQTPEDGDDRLSGGDGSDFIHAGGGADLLNGNDGNDRLFGDNGDDAIWGGLHHDHLWGGDGDDYLDVLPRESKTEKEKGKLVTYPTDPVEWWAWATISDYEGIDYIYGGFGRDAMQADVYPTGSKAGDRLIDWIGVYNIYYLCGPQYGEYVITRSPSPSVIEFLTQLAMGDGALDPGIEGSSGFEEIAIVYNADFKTNSHPPHPETPGHLYCP